VVCAGISLVLAATKWDVWQQQEPEALKVMARALRCLAHRHGAHLVYLGGLQPGGGAGEIASELNGSARGVVPLAGSLQLAHVASCYSPRCEWLGGKNNGLHCSSIVWARVTQV
jgi:hypothetical protein